MFFEQKSFMKSVLTSSAYDCMEIIPAFVNFKNLPNFIVNFPFCPFKVLEFFAIFPGFSHYFLNLADNLHEHLHKKW